MARNIDVTLGGGELGCGFYTGEYLYEAKAWAYHKSKDTSSPVVSVEVADSDFYTLRLQILDAIQAGRYRSIIRKGRYTRTYRFQCDVVWGPIVGSSRVNGDQYKWESQTAETHLNDPNKTILILR